MPHTGAIDRHAPGLAPLRRTRSARVRRRGFTLLELLIALSLSLLLLAAVYGAIHLYWRLQTVGQAEVELGQLQRAIIRQMELDVGSVIFLEPEAEEEVATSEDSMSLDEESTEGSGSSPDSSGGAETASGPYSPSSDICRICCSFCLARLTRLLMVPSAQPLISAASS